MALARQNYASIAASMGEVNATMEKGRGLWGEQAAEVSELAEALRKLDEAAIGVGEVFEAVGPLFEGVGAAMIEGASALGAGFKSALVGIIQVLAKFWATTGIGYIALGQVAKGAQLLAASAAAQVAAGFIGAIQLAEGGIVTQPTMALIGERGPEAVIPLNKAGGMGDTIIIQGDLLTQDEAYTRVTEWQQRRGRSY